MRKRGLTEKLSNYRKEQQGKAIEKGKKRVKLCDLNGNAATHVIPTFYYADPYTQNPNPFSIPRFHSPQLLSY